MNLIQAFVWNVGTCHPDAKGETQVDNTQESEYQCRIRGSVLDNFKKSLRGHLAGCFGEKQKFFHALRLCNSKT